MEADSMHHGADKESRGEAEEYVLIDLDDVSAHIDITPNTPYVLSGLDTPEPILIIDDKLKLIGKYEDTIGTCFVFSEEEVAPVVQEETGPSEANLFAGRYIVDPSQPPTKQVKPVARLYKILKFRLLLEDDVQDAAVEANTQHL